MKKKYLEIANRGFAILGLTFFSGAFDIGLTLPTGTLFPGIIRTAIRYFILLTCISVIFINRQTALSIAIRNKLLCVLTALATLSFLWSDYFTSTLSNNRDVIQMTAFGLYFAIFFTLTEQVKLIALTFGIGAIFSTLVALALPQYGVHFIDHPGAWRGIYDYKNTLGSMMIISSLALFCLPIKKQIHHFYKWVGICFFLIVMLQSTSKTSVVVSFLLVLILFLYHKFRWRGKFTIIILNIAILILGCVATFVLSNWVSLISALGRDPTLTGRTIIWSFALIQLADRPWLGFGRSAFWLPESPYGREVGASLGAGFIVPHGHNGFIDIVLDIGLMGLLLFLVIYFRAFFQAMKRVYVTKNPEHIWTLGFLIFLALNNVTESFLLRSSNVYWVLFIIIVFSLNNKSFKKQLIKG